MRLFRRQTFLVLLLLLLWAATAAALPDAFTREGDPTLYAKLHKLAEQNLRRLDSQQRKAYRRLLREQDDILMSYLLAYESDANLAQAEPQAILSNYREIVDYLARYGTSQATEFFLSYVADQTVSDERIEAYRAALLDDGLREILEHSTDELELYRAVSQWCVGRLKFQPTSGRDQSPLDITQKSILGRCEEMQILFVAAARTVGLPARPASTPWWPHTDNNHAWAEVWLDGAWHYTGDMDAAYYPDQTWFSGLIDKTVLILADGSLPAEHDEVLVSGRYDCVINSIRNYAGERTRRISVSTVDTEGQPLGGASLGILVYNWNALRPLVYLETDAEGKFSFSAGRGAFYLSAYKDGKQALQLIPSGEVPELDFSLILAEGPLPDQNEMLLYPSNPFQPKQAPEVWNEGVRLARQHWNDLDRSYQDCGAELGDSLLCAFASASRGNYPNLNGFLERVPDLNPEFLEFVLSTEPQYLDPKFLWQAEDRQLEALYRHYQLMRERFSPQDLASVIAPTVFYEELSQPYEISGGAWAMYPRSFVQKGDTRLIRLNRAMNWLKRKYRIAPDKARQGLLPLHIAAGRKHLNSVQY
ncbi:MAG TPA: transglutaminase-like domain-containing protein, partial [Candidatus Syntrophosphaera sp.]|nr:transglutaminase-like domain-containing protein [Candidatus Syntrophosphaera sp.]